MVNKVVLMGNLGHDPDLFQTQRGPAVAQLSIATNEVWKKDWRRVQADRVAYATTPTRVDGGLVGE